MKSPRDLTLIKILKSPAIMVSGISTILLSSDPNKLCDRLKLLLQEKRGGSISDSFDGEIVAIADKLLQYKCLSTEQHKFLQLRCVN